MNKFLTKKLMFFAIFFVLFWISDVTYAAEINFEGQGTVEMPYLISNYDELKNFQQLVNKGYDFENMYFYQTENIVIDDEDWTPIGFAKSVFAGNYDGGGHYVSNLNIYSTDNKNYYAFFGRISGVIANLGVESGKISAPMSAALVGETVGDEALIINCYNKAEVIGKSTSGIANNISNTDIVTCWNFGKVSGDKAFGITSCDYNVQIYACYSTNGEIAPEAIVSTTSYLLSKDKIKSEKFINKINFKVALAQYLYAQPKNVQLLQWENNDGNLVYSTKHLYLDIVGFINYNLLTVLLLVVGSVLFYKLKKYSVPEVWLLYKDKIMVATFLSGILSIFLDAALITRENNNLQVGNSLFIVIINIIFILGIIIICRNINFDLRSKVKVYFPLCVAMIIIVMLELMQFDIVPKYDACLYYGSFVQGAKLFNMDLISFIGSFVCWKWIHGLTLFIAPFEFLLPGKMIGVYIGNIIITIITMYFLFEILNNIFVKIHPVVSALTCMTLFFLPYELGLFSYLNMDSHLSLFGIWLIYAQLKKNDYLISFCGFLLSFTKITGLCFYAIYLCVIAIIDVMQMPEHNIFKKVLKWFSIKKIILWIMPALLFLFFFVYGDYFTIQNFFGTYVSDKMLKFEFDVSTLNTILQSFVYGFRWLLLGLFLIALCVLCFKKEKNILNIEGYKVYSAILFAILAVFCVLLVYNGDANCPRYTAIMNIMYIFMVPLIINMLHKKEFMKIIGMLLISSVFFVETFWTIDPMIKYTTSNIDMGYTKLYRLAATSDDRPSMNIGNSIGYPAECDIYTYNYQYSYYDSLLNKLLNEINPTEDDIFYTLDVADYEFHISGNSNRTYKIYWNTRLGKRTYDKWDKDSIYLNVSHKSTHELTIDLNDKKVPNHLYFIVAARVEDENAKKILNEAGYQMVKTYYAGNGYGYLEILEYKYQK